MKKLLPLLLLLALCLRAQDVLAVLNGDKADGNLIEFTDTYVVCKYNLYIIKI